MINRKQVICTLLSLLMTGMVAAQNGVNSPYSRYGFGILADQSTGANKGMGGVAYGLRNKYQINVGNPASYSAIDSLNFLFDGGVTLQNTNFTSTSETTGKEVKMNAKNSSLDYLAFQFRLCKHVGMTAGLLPYSKINYSFSTSNEIRNDEEGSVDSYETFSGDGGLSQAFIGAGGEIFKGFSIGANFSYLWGDLNHTITNSYSDTGINSNIRSYSTEINSYKADFGVQYTYQLSKKRSLTLGVTYSYGHKINANAVCTDYTYDNSTSTTINATRDTIRNAYELPTTFGVGLAYVYDRRLTVGLDYTLEKWASVKFPQFGDESYKQWSFNDAYKISLGAEYIPNPISKSIFKRMRYRLGGYYADPYVKVKDADTREYGVSGAIVTPLLSQRSGKTSMLTISAEYVKVDPKRNNLIKENYLRVGVGLTFSETWFYKWKVQ